MSPPPPVTTLPGGPPYEPVDIVTFSYNKDMAYAPAANTYDVRFSPPFFPLSFIPSSDSIFFFLFFFSGFVGGHRYRVGTLARIALL